MNLLTEAQVATLWDAHAWLWHGYELRGLEHLPTEGEAEVTMMALKLSL